MTEFHQWYRNLAADRTIKALKKNNFDARFFPKSAEVPIPLIPPPDSEGIRHPVPIQVARVFRLIPPPLAGAKRRWFF